MADSQTTFVEALGEERFARFRERGTVRRFPRGTAVLHERQVSDFAVVVLNGRVKITRMLEEGREVILAIRGAGDLLGEQGVLDRQPRSASIVALDDVEALAVAADDFVDLLRAEPEASLYVMRLLAQRLRDADSKRVQFAAKDSVARVASRLLELADRFGHREGAVIRIDLPLTQEELAGWAGSSREAVTKALHTLRELGWIETGRRTITVLDADELRRRAE